MCVLEKSVADKSSYAGELDTELAVVRVNVTVPATLVCEKISDGELAGALTFYIRFALVVGANSYRLNVSRNQNGTSDIYEILNESSDQIGESADLSVLHVDGPNPPVSAFRRGDYIYYRFLITSSGPSSPYGSTDREVIANIYSAYHNGINVTIVVVK
jgi:hypothetical protein